MENLSEGYELSDPVWKHLRGRSPVNPKAVASLPRWPRFSIVPGAGRIPTSAVEP